jgi:REP element-mobilizing transposase RayT
MPRSLRLEFPGAFYHVMVRGNRRETKFHDDDRWFFLGTLSEACGMTGWRGHARVLMDDSCHLFMETPEVNLVAGMSGLRDSVTRRHRARVRLRSMRGRRIATRRSTARSRRNCGAGLVPASESFGPKVARASGRGCRAASVAVRAEPRRRDKPAVAGTRSPTERRAHPDTLLHAVLYGLAIEILREAILSFGFTGSGRAVLRFSPGGPGYKVMSSGDLDFSDATEVIPSMQPECPGEERFEFPVEGPRGFFRVERK